MLTPRQLFRTTIDQELGGPGLTPERRLLEALKARRCRNVFFSAIAPVVTGLAGPNDIVVQAQTQSFGSPVIVTDVLTFDEGYDFSSGYITTPWHLMRLFVTGVGAQEDFFGAGNFTVSFLTLGHNQSNATFELDAPSLKMNFAPYLLRPGQVFQASWELLDFNSLQAATPRRRFNMETDFRGVQVLQPNDPYGQLCGKLRDIVCGYVNRYRSETFILDLEIPSTNFPVAGLVQQYNTPLQERPLLIYGISTNINGAQIAMRDPATQWGFCVPPVPPTRVINAGVDSLGVYPQFGGVPINVVAGNADLTLHEAYNMLPVPHLLEPNTALEIRLTNGLRPDGTTGAYTQTMNTLNNALVTTGNGHIAFLCRTV
jgi:hypothetical protein